MKKILFICFCLFSPLSQAKIVIVITPNRVETDQDKSATSTTVITQDEIEQSQKQTVGEVLDTVPGLHTASQGGVGKQTSVFLRGAKSEHTLVFIDGIEANDPSNPTRSFDFANLSLNNIERIEVVRGPQSVLYGSDAIGGVIQIFTKKNKSPILKTENIISGGYGSFQTRRESIQSSISDKKYSVSLGISNLDTGGISSSDGRQTPNAEKDPYSLTTIQSNFTVTPDEKTEISVFGRYETSRNSIDDFGGPGGDDPNFKSNEKDLYSGFKLKKQWGFYKPEFTLSYAHIDRDLRDLPNAADPSTYVANFSGANIKPSLLHEFMIDANQNILVGQEYERENFESTSNFGNSPDVNAYHFGNFLQYQFNNDYFHQASGLRLEKHEFFGTNLTYKISPGFTIPQSGTSINFNYATGFKAPTLFQLYDTFFGNQNLRPDKSKSYDISLEQKIFKENDVGVTFFHNQFTQTIEYNFVTNKYANIGRSFTRGFEFYAHANPVSNLYLIGQWTIMDSEDQTTGLELLRRPKNRGDFDAQYRITRKLGVGGNIVYIGSRLDVNGSGNITMPSYELVGLRASFDIKPNLTLQAKVDNIFNKKYQEIYGFGTPGINWFSTLTYSFQ